MRALLQRAVASLGFDPSVQAPVRAALLAAALLRTGLMIAAFALTGTHVMTQGDTASYLEPGRNLILHGVFAISGVSESACGPEIDRTPGYPIFAELTGMRWNNVLLTVVAQILVSLASLLLMQKIADRIFPNSSAGEAAAWLYAFEPLSIVYTARLMPETLFVLLLLLVIDRILAFQSSHKLSSLAAAGVFLAAATYVRPVSYYLVFPVAIALAITAPRQSSLRWKAPALLLVMVVPLLAAWQVRNYAETGYKGFSSIVEKNLYFFQSAEVTAELHRISLESEQKQLGYPEDKYYAAAHPEQSQWIQNQRLSSMRGQSIQVIQAHPLLYLRTHFAGVAVVAFTPCASELLQLLGAYPADGAMPHRVLNEGIASSALRVVVSHPAIAAAMALLEGCLLFLYVFAIRGACLRAHLRPALTKTAISLLLGVALYFLLISGGAQAVGRYRLPVMPILCILAAGGLTQARKKKTAEPIELRGRLQQLL
jgi:4-amino-4-deoxy-L-arabinose transferase-like glycosyltransferase